MSNKPIQTFRQGMVAASVWERAGRRGQYFELTLSRSFRRNDKEGFGYSPCFRARDVEALKHCVDAAKAWILAKDADADREVEEPDNEGQPLPPVEAAESCDL